MKYIYFEIYIISKIKLEIFTVEEQKIVFLFKNDEMIKSLHSIKMNGYQSEIISLVFLQHKI